ncbi:MAG: thermonuclease family protein [Propionibacteriaceae bacterium]|nr:thermonuclease family protein [Propionibacteriaceae bacterium]
MNTRSWRIFAGVVVVLIVIFLAVSNDALRESIIQQLNQAINPSQTNQPRQPSATASGSSNTGIVRYVSDGDTLTFSADGVDHTIRVLGIDAPEMFGENDQPECGAQEAKSALIKLTPRGTRISYTFDTKADKYDRFGRLLVYVSTPEVPDVGLELIKAGYVNAWIPASAAKPQRFADYTAAAKQAQNDKIGSWAKCKNLGR